MGPWFHQQEPVLRQGSTIVLEPGMLLAIEPQRQHWHLQDLVVVQEGAPHVISDRFPTENPYVIDV
jgi:Xaa-Pro aminopeptidase